MVEQTKERERRAIEIIAFFPRIFHIPLLLSLLMEEVSGVAIWGFFPEKNA